MLAFPPVTVSIDGRPLTAYVRAFVTDGRVFATVSPLLTRIADRVWFEGDELVVERAGRRARVRVAPGGPWALDKTYVPVGPLLRELGESVRYERAARRLDIRTAPAAGVALPTPFNPNEPSAAPSAVFTPAPPVTPRPVWTGSPLPRRTPLPLPPSNAPVPPRRA